MIKGDKFLSKIRKQNPTGSKMEINYRKKFLNFRSIKFVYSFKNITKLTVFMCFKILSL